MTKRTIAAVKAEMAKLEAELVTLGDLEAKKKAALAKVEANLKEVDRLLGECTGLARDLGFDFTWDSPSGEVTISHGYWPEVDWNSSNCY